MVAYRLLPVRPADSHPGVYTGMAGYLNGSAP
jgi:hypothetical protein